MDLSQKFFVLHSQLIILLIILPQKDPSRDNKLRSKFWPVFIATSVRVFLGMTNITGKIVHFNYIIINSIILIHTSVTILFW